MRYAVVSASVKTLDLGECRSSSELFQINLAQSLSLHGKVVIFSSRAERSAVEGDVQLVPLRSEGRLGRSLSQAADNGTADFDATLMFGYDPRRILAIRRFARLTGSVVASYVFDSHVGAIERHPWGRRGILNTYFLLGRRLLGILDGVILLNDRARTTIKVPPDRILLSRVGILPDTVPRSYRYSGPPFRIVFAGALEIYNGVLQTLEALRLVPSAHLALDIFGTGSLEEEVASLTSEDSRVRFHGQVPNAVVGKALRECDLVVCLRDLAHPVSEFAFPSKLIEAMASGVPVLASPVLTDAEFSRSVFIVESLRPEVIADQIQQASATPGRNVEKASHAAAYVRDRYSWDSVASEVVNFVRELRRSLR